MPQRVECAYTKNNRVITVGKYICETKVVADESYKGVKFIDLGNIQAKAFVTAKRSRI